jgi:hypothetical protein
MLQESCFSSSRNQTSILRRSTGPRKVIAMKKSLAIFYTGVLVWMIGITTWASLQENVWAGFAYLFDNRWGIATLSDTFFSFTTILLWIAYKEKTWLARLAWLVLVYALGSIAFGFYILRELYRISKKSDSIRSPVERLLCRTE